MVSEAHIIIKPIPVNRRAIKDSNGPTASDRFQGSVPNATRIISPPEVTDTSATEIHALMPNATIVAALAKTLLFTTLIKIATTSKRIKIENGKKSNNRYSSP